MYIYVITNSATGKIYIGQHKGNNLKKYLQVKLSQAVYELKRKGKGGGSYLFNSMRKHPKEVWSIEPLISDIQTKDELDRWEKIYIALFDTRNPEVGYNICRGGEGFTGTHSEATKKKISLTNILMGSKPPSALGRVTSDDSKETLRQIMKSKGIKPPLKPSGIDNSSYRADISDDEIATQYIGGMSIETIATRLGASSGTIWKRLKRLGISIRKTGTQGMIWVNNGAINKRVTPSDLPQYSEWVKGRVKL